MTFPAASPSRHLLKSKHPVIFFANGLGDTILNLPALRSLTTLFPQCATLVCDEGVHSVLLTELSLAQVVETPMKRNVPDWTREFSASEVAGETGKCDLFISLTPWYSRSLKRLLEKLKPVSSVGFFEDFEIQLPLDFQKHAADLAFDIPRSFDESLRLEDYASPPCLRPESQRTVQRILDAIPPAARILLVHADTGHNKMWPPERFVLVLDSFLDRHPDFLALLVGTAPQPLDCGTNARRVIPCYGVPLDVSIGLAGHADIFLGVDSCMMHAADLFRVPGVALFGASSPLQFGFRLAPGGVVCRGASMESIDAAQVLDALENVWAMRGHKSRALPNRNEE